MLSMCATIFITSGIGLQRARRFGFRVIFVGRSLSPRLGRSLALHRAAANRGSGGASPYRRPALKGSEVLRGPCRLRGSATLPAAYPSRKRIDTSGCRPLLSLVCPRSRVQV
jgi:hypothetical protein